MTTSQAPAQETYRATTFADSKPELAAPGATPERLDHRRAQENRGPPADETTALS